MTTKFRLSCGECKRRRIRCSHELPCANCVKLDTYCYYVQSESRLDNCLTESTCRSLTNSSIKSHLITIGVRDRDEGTSLTRYRYIYYLKLEKKMDKLNCLLSWVVNQSMSDPKIESIIEGFDFKLYESTFGSQISKKVVKSKPKHKLYHPEVNSKINDLLSELVQMSFEYSTICPVSFTTIQECYAKSGINSYLVICIASSMLPHYMMQKGQLERLELPDNVFYLRALHLLNSSNTCKMEIVWGTPYMLLLELQFGNLISGFVHLSTLKVTSHQLGLHCLDEQHSMCPRIDDDLNTFEMRTGWWACLNSESVASLAFMRPISLIPDPMQTQIPHPDIDFNPSPFDYAKSIDDNFSTFSDSLHLKESNFNSLAKLTWLGGCICSGLNLYLNFSNNFSKYYTRYQNLKLQYRKLFEQTEHHFSLDRYLENIQSDPVYYATTSYLSMHLLFHGHISIQWVIQNKIDIDLNNHDQAKASLSQAKMRANKLLDFIRSTMALPDHPPPKLDLTDYYLSGQLIPIFLLQIMKAFVPVQSQQDLESLELIAAVIRRYSILSIANEVYFLWCKNIIKHNGHYNIKPKTKDDDLGLGLYRERW